jgi:hypothetical protein
MTKLEELKSAEDTAYAEWKEALIAADEAEDAWNEALEQFQTAVAELEGEN